jgi:KDO2-lipid IV(A) lauroyltransferase
MVFILRLLSKCPLWVLHRIGDLLGWLAYAASPAYRRHFTANVVQAGIRRDKVFAAIGQAGRLVAELPLIWFRPRDATILHHVQWDGDSIIKDALAQGRGVVFLTPHLGCFEVAAQAYGERFGVEYGSLTVLYRPSRKTWLRPLIETSRDRPGLATAPATLAGVRQMIKALRRGEAIGLLPDQVPAAGLGIWAPFFRKPAYTMTLAARLVQQTGAVPLLAWGERLPGGAGFIVRVSALGEVLSETSLHPLTAASALNQAMERLVLSKPEQYLWGYNRYKAPA